MGKTSAPPLNGEAIRQARVRKYLTQAEVAAAVREQCEPLGIKFDRSGLSMIESGTVKRPSLKVVPVLAAVLGLEPHEMFKTAPDEPEDDESEDEAA
jgi:transcriptional regulator with XRE-family HTH domain